MTTTDGSAGASLARGEADFKAPKQPARTLASQGQAAAARRLPELLLEVIRVDLDVLLPLARQLVLGEAGVDGTRFDAGVAVDAPVSYTHLGYSGGGGVSTVFALPSYQSGITGMITSGRNQPDISLPFFPVAVYTGGSWGEYLGTSWSSPASVAMVIEANQLHSTKLGWIDPTIYSLFGSTGYSDYYTPCTSGSNGAYSCSATQYNQAAGIGAPKAWALANAL